MNCLDENEGRAKGENMQLFLGPSVQIKQTIRHLLKQELRQELRLVLKQMLKILNHLVQNWEISMEEIRTLNLTLVNLPNEDRQDLAHELVRQSKAWESETLIRLLRFASTWHEDLSGVSDFTGVMNQKLEFRRVAHQQKAIVHGLQLILELPEFLGG